MYLVQALILQATEMERRSGLPLQRARAIEDDEPVSPLGAMLALQAQVPAPCSSSSQLLQLAMETACATPVVEVKQSVVEKQQQQQVSEAATAAETDRLASASALTTLAVTAVATAEEPASTNEPAVAVLVDLENDADDDNTEDTVRTLRGGNHQSAIGQSMLDKLLSMNSDSSSEEAPSNISTDTLAACCSEDISEISMDNYDADSKLPASVAAATSATVELDTTPALEPSKLDRAASTLEHLSPEGLQQQQQQQQSSQNERNLCGKRKTEI